MWNLACIDVYSLSPYYFVHILKYVKILIMKVNKKIANSFVFVHY